jgi:phage pi2 protein 07
VVVGTFYEQHEERVCDNLGWIHLAQDRIQWWTPFNYSESLGYVKEEFFDQLSSCQSFKKDFLSWR